MISSSKNPHNEVHSYSPLELVRKLTEARGYKYVFIDLDDTLWDFHANAESALHQIYETRDLKRYFDSFQQYFGMYTKRNLELWELYGKGEINKENLNRQRFSHPFVMVGVDDAHLPALIGIEYLEILPSRTALVPYAKELLEYLTPNYPLTIVSNGFVEVQYRKLKSCGIEHYFSHVVLSEEAKSLKPDKQIFEHSLQLNKAEASETIMIGDSYAADITGARNAGIDQVWFTPNSSPKNAEFPSTYQIKQLKEIRSIL